MLNQKDHLERLLDKWRNEPTIANNIMEWRTEPRRLAKKTAFPASLQPDLVEGLKRLGYQSLYAHQIESLRAIQHGENTVIVTGTASGKTLCYTLPIIDSALKDAAARALFIFPTKALAQDQLNGLKKVTASIINASTGILPKLTPVIFDGDTPTGQRAEIRKNGRLVLTNPDMVHMGILPHHTLWENLFRNLRYIVIDEIHTYRGIFGSHLGNVIRRLKRITHFYGSNPIFILTSATIANPQEFAEKLIEEPVMLVDQDGSPRGSRHFLLYNPPLVNPDLGLRRSASSESIHLADDLLAANIQTILFVRARRSVELMLRNFRNGLSQNADSVRGYRSGYLPGERRQIERALREGEARAVISTYALELGVDIGNMDAAIMVGYPGTIASTRQQAGRAGRRDGSSVGILVASASPIDQFLVKHPSFIFDRSPEQALIDPNNLLILLQHLRCAAFELPFQNGEQFGEVPVEMLVELLTILAKSGMVHQAGDKFFWAADQYPADQISLRSTSGQTIALMAQTDNGWSTAGIVDYSSALWMVHPGAIYLHEGLSYQVDELNLKDSVARMHPAEVDYFTEAQKKITIEKVSEIKKKQVAGAEVFYGELLVTAQVTGFRRIRWLTNESLGAEPLELPATQLRTTGYWLVLDDTTVEDLRNRGLWKNDPNQYGPGWERLRKLVRTRDQFTCQVCGMVEKEKEHHVHHKIPFRAFAAAEQANRPENLVTLCDSCHEKVEQSVRIRSGMAGLSYVMHQLAPLFLMCDTKDLEVTFDPQSTLSDGKATLILFEEIPAGIGLSEKVFQLHAELVRNMRELVEACECRDGCPACVGPGGENGAGGKQETLALLALLEQIPAE